MNEAQKDEIVHELRRGIHRQGKHALCNVVAGQNYYCCLGIMMLLYSQKCKVEITTAVTSIVGQARRKFDGETYTLTPEAMLYYGVHKGCCVIEHPMMKNKSNVPRPSIALSDLNDGGFTFSQIADVLEHFWEDLV